MMRTRKGRGATRPRPVILSWPRLLTCLGAGLLSAGLASVAGLPEMAVLVGWAVLGHALLSYLFGTVAIAVAVKLVTGLGQ